jgi:uncharacterized protein YuzE
MRREVNPFLAEQDYRLSRSGDARQAMKMHYDQKSDALYLRLDDSKIIESAEVEPGIVLDYDANNQVVGIEILRVKERVPAADLKHLDFKVA